MLEPTTTPDATAVRTSCALCELRTLLRSSPPEVIVLVGFVGLVWRRNF